MFDYYTKLILGTAEELKKLDSQKESLHRLQNMLVQQRQDICPHTNTREEDDIDYHNNVDWINVICNDCEKLLSKK